MLSQLERLAESLEGLTKEDNCKNLLTNLCDGLETFLGFDPSSKGYDGSGIVYSDLDRLCDGVMGFLSGVLGAVKDDDAVKTYDNYITKPDKKLNEVLDLLTNKIGSGRAGLVASVRAVQGWLEGYDEKLQEKTSHVINDLGKLRDDISGVYTTNISAGENLQTQLTRWQSTVNDIDKYLSSTETRYINKLDNALSINIMHEIKPVKQVVEHLKSVAGNDVFIAQVATVDEQLRWQRERVVNSIKDKSEELREVLNGEIRTVLGKIFDLKKNKAKQFDRLRNVVSMAKDEANRLLGKFDGEYWHQITRHFEAIKGALSDVNKTENQTGKMDTSKLREDAEKIKLTLETISLRLGGHVGELENWMHKTENYINEFKEEEVEKIMDLNKGGFGSWKENIELAAANIKKQTDNFDEQFQAVKRQLEAEVRKVNGGTGALSKLKNLEELKKTVDVPNELAKFKSTKDGWNLNEVDQLKEKITRDMRRHIGEQILQQLKTDVDEIKGNNAKKGMQGIKEKVKLYAVYIGENMAKEDDSRGRCTLSKWADEILKNAGVQRDISHYVMKNQDDAVKKAIKDKIRKTVQSIPSGQKPGDKGTVQDTLKSIQDYLRTVSQHISSEAEEGKIKQFVDTLGPTLTDSNKYLYRHAFDAAVQVVLQYVSASASNLADEFESFANNKTLGDINIGENVQDALTTAAKLSGHVSAAHRMATTSQSSTTSDPSNYILTSVNRIADQVNLSDSNLCALLQAVVNKGIEKLHMKLTNSVIAELDAVSSNVDTFSKPAEDARQALKQKSGEVTDNLNELLSWIAETGSIVKDRLQTLINYKIYGSLTEVKNKIVTLRTTDLYNVIYTDIKAVTDIIASLESLPGVVATMEQETEMKIKTLKTNIDLLQKLLDNIEVNVKLADDEIEKSIDVVQQYLQYAQENSSRALDNFKSQLLAISADAFQTVTNEVRTLFADSHKSDLSALKTLLTKQLKIITCTIHKNLNTGLKGFLKTLSGDHVSRTIDGLKVEKSNTNLLDELKNCLTQKPPHDLQSFRNLSDTLRKYLDPILFYTHDEIMTVQPPSGPDDPAIKKENDASHKLDSIKYRVDDLLDYLKSDLGRRLSNAQTTERVYLFDHTYTNLHEKLSTSLSALSPSAFANPRHPELLDAVKKGLQGFVTEMGRVYVNGYDGGEGIEKLSNLVTNGDTTDGKLTDDGRNLSKVFLTILETLYHDFDGLQGGCKPTAKGNKQQLCLHVEANGKRDSNRLGSWLKERGYNVPSTKDKQDGELDSKKTGNNIHGDIITKKLDKATANKILTTWKTTTNSGTAGSTSGGDINLIDILTFFHDHLIIYFKTSHLRHISAPKAPCNIYQMLQWLTGLRHNPMYDKLCGHFKGLFKTPEGDKAHNDAEYKLESTEKNMNADELSTMLRRVCNYSVDVLIAIQGHGHADGVYAVDFYTNQSNITYPSSAGACFDMLVDVSNRVYEQLNFIYKICQNGPESGGWRDCQYGQHVAGSAWNCNKKQCANQTCPQVADQNANQNANQNAGQNADQNAQQNCDRHPTCGVKSPLQSFLEDGLQGFLPHQFKAPGCKLECAVPNHFGKPCKTPMGFRDIGLVASHTQNGTHLRDAVYKLCGDVGKPLTRLCAFTKCLLKTPPQTLGDIFGFFQGYLANWSGGNPANTALLTHKPLAFKNAIKEAYFGNEYDLSLPSLFASSSHRNTKGTHKKGDLFSITSCESSDEATCGMYVQSINLNLYSIFAASNNKQYLSWVVYISETFYALLKALLDECCKNCDTAGTRCHDKSCVEDCEVKRYYDLLKSNSKQADVKQLESKNHDAKCHSIVECQNTHPTLYKYGFTFGSQRRLSGLADGGAKKRTCKDFCSALKGILNEETKVGAALAKVIYETIPEYFWLIRQPFFWMTVALWSLSLFYVICVMVGRLDVLHIRSHLRSPSSHKITAQSLLAAAQVGRLAKISYLQP